MVRVPSRCGSRAGTMIMRAVERATLPRGQRSFETVSQMDFTQFSKLAGEFGAGRGVDSRGRQPGARAVAQVGDVELVEAVLVADFAHPFPVPIGSGRTFQRYGGIGKRQTIVPTAHDRFPRVVLVQ